MKAEFYPVLVLVYTVSVSRSTSKCVSCLFHLFLSSPPPQKWPCVGFGFCFQTGPHYVSEASLGFGPASIPDCLDCGHAPPCWVFISFCLRQGLVAFVLQSFPQSLEWYCTHQGLAFDSLYMCLFLFGIQAPNFNNQRLKFKSL